MGVTPLDGLGQLVGDTGGSASAALGVCKGTRSPEISPVLGCTDDASAAGAVRVPLAGLGAGVGGLGRGGGMGLLMAGLEGGGTRPAELGGRGANLLAALLGGVGPMVRGYGN